MNANQYIRENYETMSNRQMGDALGMRVEQVRDRLKKMGLRREGTAFPEEQWVEVEVCKLLTCRLGDYATAPRRFITIRARDVE